MKKIIYLISLLMLMSSCSDFLELDNPNKKTTLSSWKTLDDLDSGIATIYNAFLEEPAGY